MSAFPTAARRAPALLGLLAALAPALLHAQALPEAPASERPITIGIAGGVSVPRQGATASTLRAGLHTQGFVLVRLPAGLPPLRFNVDYTRQRLSARRVAGTDAAARTADVDPTAAIASAPSILAGVVGTKVDLLRGPVRPYLVVGVGGSTIGADVAADGADADRTLALGLDGGAGISVRLGALRAFAETRLQNVYTQRKGLVDARSIQQFPVTFGLSF